jgi:hypothetical protein
VAAAVSALALAATAIVAAAILRRPSTRPERDADKAPPMSTDQRAPVPSPASDQLTAHPQTHAH